MKRLSRFMALAAFAASLVYAQDIAGTRKPSSVLYVIRSATTPGAGWKRPCTSAARGGKRSGTSSAERICDRHSLSW